jgi:hypothetical protein
MSKDEVKKRRLRWWHGCLIAFGLFVLGILTIIILTFAATRVAAQTAENFLLELSAGTEIGEVYEVYVADIFKEATSLEQFSRYVDNNPILTDVQSVSFYSREIVDYGAEGKYTVLIGSMFGTEETADIEFELFEVGDNEWEISYLMVNPLLDQ